MALKVEKYSVDKANVLPSGKAAVALAEGDLVYLNSSGLWALAVATTNGATNAQGIVVTAALQYETISPVRIAHINGAPSGTIGNPAYLSATGTTGNTITPTKPTAYQVQPIGFYRTATEIEINVLPVQPAGNLVATQGVTVQVGGTSVTGLTVGTNSVNALGFYGATPIVRPSGTSQGAITLAGTSYGAEAANIQALVNEIRSALVNLGLIAGA